MIFIVFYLGIGIGTAAMLFLYESFYRKSQVACGVIFGMLLWPYVFYSLWSDKRT